MKIMNNKLRKIQKQGVGEYFKVISKRMGTEENHPYKVDWKSSLRTESNLKSSRYKAQEVPFCSTSDLNVTEWDLKFWENRE